MTIVEKAAYLKGLTDGLGLDAESRDGKLWNALNDLLGDIAHEIEDLQSSNLDMAEVIDDISEDLSYLEEITCDLDRIPDDEDDDFDFGCDGNCGSCQSSCFEDGDEEMPSPIRFPSIDDDDFSELVYDGDEYELTCPTCGMEITVTEEQLQLGSIKCPSCGEELEFEFDEDDGEDE